MATESDTLSRLSDALAMQGVDCETVAVEELPETLSALVEPPAVGVELPFAPGVLAESGVETDVSPTEVAEATTGVTPVDFAVAAYGSLAIPQRAAGHEPVSLYPERHVAVVPESEIYPDLGAGFDRLDEAFADGTDSVVFATGPSATADMGGLVQGVHGPGEVQVVVVSDR